jgi:predicted nucleotidyltransferase
MDGRPLLGALARVLYQHGLEAILIGNAAAALNGAPVTTIDLDFLFPKTPESLRKLRAVAKSLGATIWRPNYPASDFRRLARDEDLMQVDFMTEAAGVKSFASLRSRAQRVDIDGYTLLVADLRDIINSKRMADRPQDRAVLGLLEATLNEKRRTRKDKLDALRVATERAQREQILRWLRVPPDQRTHFLRKRIGIQASCL